jgi:preprotein translocase subunit SecG
MFGVILMLHILVCVCLVFIVLIQQSKGAGLGGVFGGGGGEALFGGRGAAPFLVKATTALAVMFMLTSLVLTIVSARTGRERPAVEKLIEQPATGMELPIPTLPDSSTAFPESTE